MNPRSLLPLLAAAALVSCQGTSSQPEIQHSTGSSTTAQVPAIRDKAPGAWYEGGNLHQATLEEWRLASYENRLATCADFCVSLAAQQGVRYPSMHAVRRDAEALVERIDQAGSSGFTRRKPVAEIAASRWKRVDG